jgi:hypothetical protein
VRADTAMAEMSVIKEVTVPNRLVNFVVSA